MSASPDRPRLRPVEVFPAQQAGREVIVVQDPSGLAESPLVVSPLTLLMLSFLDGQHTLEQINQDFEKQSGRSFPVTDFEKMLEQLDAARYLDSPRFAAHLQARIEAYREAPTRSSPDARTLGAGPEGLPATLDQLMERNQCVRPAREAGQIRGLIAPHLDFERGQPCYADIYGLLAERPAPGRVVILGTNHAGMAGSTVLTGKDFETPLGITQTDRDFIAELERRCKTDLKIHEFDHQREHSVELQVLMLQHILGADRFSIVPVLCADPCGPTGTAPLDGEGVDLDVFARQLGAMVREEGQETIIVAGADLSHVGPRFGDDRELDEAFLTEIERQDQLTLEAVTSGTARDFLQSVTDRDNQTRICSTGCLYAIMAALPETEIELLRYHQAVDPDNGTGVTCASLVLWGR